MIYIFSRPFFRGEKGESYFYKTCGVSRHHHPLNPLNPLNLLNLLNREISCLNASCTMEE